MDLLLHPYRIRLMKHHTIMLYRLITYRCTNQIPQPAIRHLLINRIFITINLIIRIILEGKQIPQFRKAEINLQQLH